MITKPRTIKGMIFQALAIVVCLVAAALMAHAIIDITADTSPAENWKLK
jgi:hypothetical protein